jgi:uncharacterized DUF497 family protein
LLRPLGGWATSIQRRVILKVKGLIWLEDVVQKLFQKHRVQQDEVGEVFDGQPRFFFVENGHRRGENVYAALGQAEAGRYLTVIFIYTLEKEALILSARDMSSSERKRYERK